MALLKICAGKYNSGFTVLEILLAMGLAAAIGGLGLFVATESLRAGIFKNDRDAAIAALARARNRAISNVCFGFGCTDGKAHGVRFDPSEKEIIIFQGDDFASRDAAADESVKFEYPAIRIDSAVAIDIVFEPLSGGSVSREVVLNDGSGHIARILVNAAGQIDWR